MFTVIKSSGGDKIKSVYMWSDSQIVLYWLHSDKKLKQFVSNRVIQIKKVYPAHWWSYCPSADNPADLLTRGISFSTLHTSTIWTHGPRWILHKKQQPVWSPTDILQIGVTETETLSTLDQQHLAVHSGVETIIDINRYSMLTKLLYVTAYVLRFIECLKSPARTSKITGTITVNELSKGLDPKLSDVYIFPEIKHLKCNPTSRIVPLP